MMGGQNFRSPFIPQVPFISGGQLQKPYVNHFFDIPIDSIN